MFTTYTYLRRVTACLDLWREFFASVEIEMRNEVLSMHAAINDISARLDRAESALGNTVNFSGGFLSEECD